jgi:hypothetical protein
MDFAIRNEKPIKIEKIKERPAMWWDEEDAPF